MKALLTAVVLGLTLSVSSSYAQEKDKKATPQQQRMKDCNAEAGKKDMKGDARKDFMSRCLKGETTKGSSSQERMKTCNRDASAKNLKGDDRKKFMSECLKA